MARQKQESKGGLKPVPQNVPPEMQASLLHLGTMMGHPGQRGDDDFSGEVEKHLDEMEANQKKMESAQRGGSEMGPSQFETQQADQAQALQQQATVQGAQQAQQAQGAQMPQNVPVEAPGPAGESAPYQAQEQEPPAPTGYKPPPGGS